MDQGKYHHIYVLGSVHGSCLHKNNILFPHYTLKSKARVRLVEGLATIGWWMFFSSMLGFFGYFLVNTENALKVSQQKGVLYNWRVGRGFGDILCFWKKNNVFNHTFYFEIMKGIAHFPKTHMISAPQSRTSTNTKSVWRLNSFVRSWKKK